MDSQSTSCVRKPMYGWGRYPIVEQALQRPEKSSAFRHAVQPPQGSSVLARGGGRSYGDAALAPEGTVVLTERLNRFLSFNEETGVLRCEAGVSMQEILDVFVPRGWFPAVTPGTKFVTMGGAVAFDVHGKNHVRDGAFSQHLISFMLTLASGETVECSREKNADLFWATIGGMGLTGFISEVEFTLCPIQTAYIHSHGFKATNLDDAIALFTQYESQYQYSAAWIDCLASGRSLGRSIITFGNHAELSDLTAEQQADPLVIQSKRPFKVPVDFPSGILNRYTMSTFNHLYYNRQRQRSVESIVDYDSFFYPLDVIWDWNRIYGKGGFVQHQCAIPVENSKEALTKILQFSSKKGWGSFLAVLKRLGPQEGWLSFPIDGYTLALDIPVQPGLWKYLDQLDQIVVEHGGRIYLAKDARVGADVFRQMYPSFPKWLDVKSKVDPLNQFSSSLSERLNIVPTPQKVCP
ncbi:MAG: FAD-binding oxidoreductase [Cyanobacteria bacterium J06626_14]